MHYPLVTIVGGSGFVGRHTVKLLAAAGYRIRVVVRNVPEAQFLKTAGTVGSIAIEYGDITQPKTLAGKFAGSDAVINLVSIAYESGRQKFSAINIDGARTVAEEAKRAGASAFIQMSALGIDKARNTKYGKTKLEGEEAVRAAFPTATILRPSLIVGPEDHFFQRFARLSLLLPFLPLIGGGDSKFQPVMVTDVTRAILDCLLHPETQGQTYELAGPKIYSFREMLELLGRTINRRPRLVKVPSALASLKAFFLELLPFAPMLTRDQVKLLAHDNIATAGTPSFAELGIVPTPIEQPLVGLLSRFIKA